MDCPFRRRFELGRMGLVDIVDVVDLVDIVDLVDVVRLMPIPGWCFTMDAGSRGREREILRLKPQ